ncbi:MAG: hypothetical protein HQ546_04820 [Planctomycetes bacterium]|nr:hypothetical protein [Planctomycetota bacterium]
MITRLSAAIVGLLAFAGMLLAGLAAGNPLTTILQRALAGLFGGMTIGYVGGYLSQLIVNESVMRMVDADANVELAQVTAKDQQQGEYEEVNAVADNSAQTVRKDSKEDGEKDREQGSLTREQTLAVRAAKRVFPQA